jgi:predicted Zn finger-like uncharacterized protein
MQINCPNCQKSLLLDDAKLPAQAVRLKCPACGGAVPFVPPAPPAAAGAANGGSLAPAPLEPGSPRWERLKREVTAEVLRHLGVAPSGPAPGEEDEEGEGRRKALVCEDEALFQVTIKEALEKLGYSVVLAGAREEALAHLEKTPFDLVTVDNRLPDDPEGGYKILQAINALLPEQRRKMFVAFISADLSTMDTNSAFVLGANLTVAKKDVKRLDRVLAEGLREHRKSYATFFQVADELQQQEA